MTLSTQIQFKQAGLYRRFIPNLIIFLFICNQACAYTDWKSISPGGGGWCMGVFPHPTEPKTVWLTTDISGLFKSTDGGENFENKVGAILHAEGGQAVVPGYITQFAIDPAQPNICYYASYHLPASGNLWKSTDSGETWSKLPDTSALFGAAIIVDHQGTVFCVKRDMRQGNSDAPGELWVSADGGKTFEIRKMPFPCVLDKYRQTIRLAVSKSNRLYACNPFPAEKGMYYTEDKGNTWKPVEGLAGKTVGAIACSPTKPDLTLVICSDTSIYYAEDGKKFTLSIKKVTPVRGNYTGDSKAVGIGISKSGIILAAVAGSVPTFKSVDNGKKFTILDSPILQEDWRFHTNSCHNLTGFAASPCGEAFYRTTSTNVMASLDGGNRWAIRCKGIKILCLITAPVVDISDPGRVHFAAADKGHFYTTDLGATQNGWFSSENQFCGVSAIGQDTKHPEVFYKLLHAPNGPDDHAAIYKSIDRGVSWSRTNPKGDLGIRFRVIGTLIVDPKDPRHLYLSTTTPKREFGKAAEAADPIYHLLESNDAGVNFKPVKDSPKSLKKLILADSGNIYGVQGYFAVGCPAYKYDRKAQAWSKIYEKGVSDLAVDAHDENIMLLSDYTKGEIMKSSDGGKTWLAKKDMNGKSIWARSVYIDPIKPSYMLASAQNGNGGHAGILRSTDAGETWHPLVSNYQSAHIIGFVYGGIPGRVYLWAAGNGAARMDGLYADEYTGSRISGKR